MNSIYGVDILPDNVAECRERILKEFPGVNPFDVMMHIKCADFLNSDCQKRSFWNYDPADILPKTQEIFMQALIALWKNGMKCGCKECQAVRLLTSAVPDSFFKNLVA